MNKRPFEGIRIVLGVTGSIAAYKAADLASKLTQEGARLDVILTRAATRFIEPLTFQSLTGRQAYTDDDLWGAQAHVLHVGLAQRADMMVIAPATANTIAKLAQGIADDLLSLTALALGTDTKPGLFVAPAMDAGMFAHEATQRNIQTLEKRGAILVGPEEGRLASGLLAKGRMTEPADLIGHMRYHLTRNGPLQGRKVIVTAGGTREPLDPVRVLTNRSSGKQGYALAQACLDAGAEVVLISPPLSLAIPRGTRFINVQTAEEMKEAVLKESQRADILFMAAAVADFRPANRAGQKIKKEAGPPVLELEPTPDILSALAQQREKLKRPQFVVGFAAETEDLIANAKSKLEEKRLDLMVVNDVGAEDAGFEVDTNRVTLVFADREVEPFPLMTKLEVAQEIIQKVILRLESKA